MEEAQQEHQGTCLCGKVKVVVNGPPAASGYCHCETCRKWHAAPLNAWVAWANEAVSVTEGEDLLKAFRLSEMSHRHWCSNCGTGVINVTDKGLTIVYAAILEGSDFVNQPGLHVNYATRVVDVPDTLPKFKDFPSEFGGTGEMIT